MEAIVTDWISDNINFLERRRGLEREQRCERCRGWAEGKSLILLDRDDVPYTAVGHYHVRCAEEALSEYQKYCSLCGEFFVNRIRSGTNDLCEKCNHGTNKIEAARVRRSNQRTLGCNLPATLTLREWLGTLSYFGWSCAYCGGAYKLLEHFIPVSLGGGTAKSNCVPACYSCNIIKKNEHPFYSGLGNVYRISTYLKGRG